MSNLARFSDRTRADELMTISFYLFLFLSFWPRSRFMRGIRYTGTDTLDEAVSVTIMRDLNAIGSKIVQVLNPTGKNAVLRDWDLWGPLIVCYTSAVHVGIELMLRFNSSV